MATAEVSRIITKRDLERLDRLERELERLMELTRQLAPKELRRLSVVKDGDDA